MKKRFFCLVCEAPSGTVFVNPFLHECFELQECITRNFCSGVKVIDFKTVDVDFSDYEH